MKRIIFLTPLVLFILGCTQEHLLLLKNMNEINLLSMDQILTESGLNPGATKTKVVVLNNTLTNIEEITTIETVSKTNETIPKVKPVEVVKELYVPRYEDFSIYIDFGDGLLTLRFIEGDIVYQKDRSEIQRGYFLFKSGYNNGKIDFQLYDREGALKTNISYLVKVEGKTDVVVVEPKTNIIVKPPVKTNDVTTNALVDPKNPKETDISKIILNSIRGMTYREALRELQKMFDSADFSAQDKQQMVYKMADIALEQKMTADSETYINRIADSATKELYMGRLNQVKRLDREALKNYISSLSGDQNVKRQALTEVVPLITKIGTVGRGLLERLESEAENFRREKIFYGNIQIDLAILYQYVPDMYASEEILKRVIDANYSADITRRAKAVYEQLKKDYLDYK